MDKKTHLKRWIEEHGINQRWLCEKTGITQAWMSKIVNVSEPKVRDAQKIAQTLNTTVDELWPLEEEQHED